MESGAAGYVIKDPGRRYFKTLPVTISHAIKFKRIERKVRNYEDNLIKIVETRSHQLNEKNNQLYLEIQKRMRAKEELMRTTEQLSVLLESLPIIPYACNAEDGSSITYVSNAIEEITGFGPDEFIQDSRFWTKHIHPADRKQVMAELAVKSGSHKHHFEYRFRIADGTFKWFSDTRRYVRLPDGTVSTQTARILDVSVRQVQRKLAGLRRNPRWKTLLGEF